MTDNNTRDHIKQLISKFELANILNAKVSKMQILVFVKLITMTSFKKMENQSGAFLRVKCFKAKPLEQWFSTFFRLRHLLSQKNFGDTQLFCTKFIYSEICIMKPL